VLDSKLHRRLLDISYKYKLHHLGSYFSCVDIIDEIYSKMKEDDLFILSNGHASVALYAVIEKYFGFDAEKLLEDLGEHPSRDEDRKIHCTTGSLGMGITVAVGRALIDKNRDVFCLISDGECYEGSVWEALQFAYKENIDNLKIYVNANGYAAYKSVDLDYLEKKLTSFYPDIKFIKTTVNKYGLGGLSAHYDQMTHEMYELAKKEIHDAE
tara:strand:- start:173 stop:808 length:636 start_codon:yes stop_codon:yes gene_type:complete